MTQALLLLDIVNSTYRRSYPLQDALVELEVIGSVPLWLKGSYVRNGVGHFEPVMQFLFDGFGMLARFQIMNGRVSSMQR